MHVQAVARRLLERMGGSPLMIKLAAGRLCDDGPDDLRSWRRLDVELALVLAEEAGGGADPSQPLVGGFPRAMYAFEVTTRTLHPDAHRLLAVLALFPPVQEVRRSYCMQTQPACVLCSCSLLWLSASAGGASPALPGHSYPAWLGRCSALRTLLRCSNRASSRLQHAADLHAACSGAARGGRGSVAGSLAPKPQPRPDV
jgi:hypothetical protein